MYDINVIDMYYIQNEYVCVCVTPTHTYIFD